jgi:hypothetical protein
MMLTQPRVKSIYQRRWARRLRQNVPVLVFDVSNQAAAFPIKRRIGRDAYHGPAGRPQQIDQRSRRETAAPNSSAFAFVLRDGRFKIGLSIFQPAEL